MIPSLFAISGRLNRKAFWLAFVVHLGLSIGLLGLMFGISYRLDLFDSMFVISVVRIPLIVQQASVYIRRLNDAGRSRSMMLIPLAVYLIMSLITAYMIPGAIDARRECDATAWDNCGDAAGFEAMALITSLGPLTGFPGPITLVFAFFVGFFRTGPKPGVIDVHL